MLPKFNGASDNRVASLDWVTQNSETLMGAATNAAMATIQKHYSEQAEGKK